TGLPAVARVGTTEVAAWSTGNDVVGARLDTSTMTVLDASPFLVTKAGNQAYPAAAFDGTNYLVVWSQAGKLYATRVSQASALVDTQPIVVAASGASGRSEVAFGGGVYFAVWESSGSGIKGARIGTDGTVVDATAVTVTSASAQQVFPRITYGAGTFFVVW